MTTTAPLGVAEHRRVTFPWPVLGGLVALPVAFVATMLVAWQMAIAHLGQEPVPYQHDPQHLSESIRFLNRVWFGLLLASIVGITVSAASAVHRLGPGGRRALSLLPLAMWMVALGAIRANWDAFVWFID